MALYLGHAHLPILKGHPQRVVARKGDTEGVVDSVWTGVKCKVRLTVPCVGGRTSTGAGIYRVGQPIRKPYDAKQGRGDVFYTVAHQDD